MSTTIRISVNNPSQKLQKYMEKVKEVKKEQLQRLREGRSHTHIVTI